MKTRKRRRASPLPLLTMQLALSSWKVIARRSLMMAQNRCSSAEYQRMVIEKMAAAQRSAATFLASGGRAGPAALLAPWHSRVRANAKRLRRP
jgi:hypothetical protein